MNRFIVAFAAVVIVSAPPAFAAEHVVNGGFETGTFSGWAETDPYSQDPNLVGVDATDAHTGQYGAYFGTEANQTFGNPVDYDTLTQNIATVAGQSYTLSFWISNGLGYSAFTPAPTDSVTVKFGSQTLLSQTAPAPSPYTRYSYTVTGNGSPTQLSFRFSNIAYYWSLDDVSLTDAATTSAVPEPTTWGTLLVGFAMVGAAARRRRRVAIA